MIISKIIFTSLNLHIIDLIFFLACLALSLFHCCLFNTLSFLKHKFFLLLLLRLFKFLFWLLEIFSLQTQRLLKSFFPNFIMLWNSCPKFMFSFCHLFLNTRESLEHLVVSLLPELFESIYLSIFYEISYNIWYGWIKSFFFFCNFHFLVVGG